MKLSTKGRYALRLMFDLAVNSNGGYIPLREVSERQQISDKYLEQIISSLSKAGYVKGARGASGGYIIAIDPDTTTAGDIVRALEGDFYPVSCIGENNKPCPRMSTCVTVELWQKMKDAIDDVVDSVTLSDLIRRHHEKNNDLQE